MPEPVLVVHGVGNDSESEITARAKQLNDALGAGWDFIPIFWGDLGAQTGTAIFDTLPVIAGTEVRGAETAVGPALIEALLGGDAVGPVVRSADEQEELIVRGAAATRGISPAEAVRAAGLPRLHRRRRLQASRRSAARRRGLQSSLYPGRKPPGHPLDLLGQRRAPAGAARHTCPLI